MITGTDLREQFCNRLRELDSQNVLPDEIFTSLYNEIIICDSTEIERFGLEIGQQVAHILNADDVDYWYEVEELKNKYVKALVLELFYEVLAIDFEEYKDNYRGITGEQAATEEVVTINHHSSFIEWAQKGTVDLHKLTTHEIYEAVVDLEQVSLDIDLWISDEVINSGDASTVVEALDQIENNKKYKSVKEQLLERLELLLKPYKVGTSEPKVEQKSNVDIEAWATWYNKNGGQVYNQAQETQDSGAPNKIYWYENVNLEKYDQYEIHGQLTLHEEDVLICNGPDGEVFVGLAKLVTIQGENGEKQVITWNKEMIVEDVSTLTNERYCLLAVEKNDGPFFQEAVVNGQLPKCTVYRLPFKLSYEPLNKIDSPLCIDFGTTNTTVGCYLKRNYVPNMPTNSITIGNVHYEGLEIDDYVSDGVNFIHFYDKTSREKRTIEEMKNFTIPTVVYADAIDPSSGEIRYQYGYDALAAVRKIKDNTQQYLTERKVGTLIYGLKRWINELDVLEELIDSNGNKAEVSRRDIVKGYIEYVIERATHQVKGHFNKLHFSAPIKMKAQFIQAFTEMLPQHEVLTDQHTLDEGVAVLYDVIHQEMDRKKNEQQYKGQAFIIDCGGGTTDLAKCEYEVERGGFLGEINLLIKTNFVNGNPNFGGNNLTYRIMQMLKIKLAPYYLDNMLDKAELDKITSVDEYVCTREEAVQKINESISESEESAITAIYKELEDTYKKQEKIIPTRFKQYESKSSQYVEKVRHNFYFLWEMAENIKRDFFSKLDKVTMDLDEKIEAKVGQFKVYVERNGDLQEQLDKPEKFSFTIREVEQLIVPDIYAVEHQFLNNLDFENILKMTTIKLTGQSCRIPYFRDMLKEFIPGKYIRSSSQSKDSAKQALELKLACVRGVIHYWRDQAKGEIIPRIEQLSPVIPYDVLLEAPVKVLDQTNKVQETNLLLYKGEKIGSAVGVAAISNRAEYVEVKIRNERKQIGGDRIISLVDGTESYYTTAQLQDKLKANGFTEGDLRLQLFNDPSLRRFNLLFTYTDADAWGFTIQTTSFDEEQGQWKVRSHYEPFEGLDAYENFFDGAH
ncbi:hypothetical protein SAMN05880501_105181 [Ureibacillus xyleni]|uniref:Molecular chaperone n=1 Tax=Ureibacillus xyleni TaxID=614648 RepID=A0A285SM34_9BACL|nr:hypothetical protein [Ureibacillus xyleni]SOC09116.1 hypothetical protein SAMN05880501_105181 [Ureibacillus xyleni]